MNAIIKLLPIVARNEYIQFNDDDLNMNADINDNVIKANKLIQNEIPNLNLKIFLAIKN